MTGFGQASVSDRQMSADVTVRTLNGKHLKTKVRLEFSIPAVEERIRSLVARHMTRGTVEVSVRLDWAGAGAAVLNERMFAGYVRELQALGKKFGLAGEVQVDRVAMLPGVAVADGLSAGATERVWRKIRPAVAEAIEKTMRMRASEGRALAADLRRACSRSRRLLSRIRGRLPRAAQDYRERLTRRVHTLLKDTGAEVEQASIARELILHAERSDLSEELCRMQAHLAHFLEALEQEGTGRKLDFIAQEMHREANTLAAKANDPALSERTVDLRGEVDRIREQVQNLE